MCSNTDDFYFVKCHCFNLSLLHVHPPTNLPKLKSKPKTLMSFSMVDVIWKNVFKIKIHEVQRKTKDLKNMFSKQKKIQD
jgi:hypothetical protein